MTLTLKFCYNCDRLEFCYLHLRGIILSNQDNSSVSLFFQQHPVPAVWLDRDLRCVAINDAFLTVFHLDKIKVINHPFAQTLHFSDWQIVFEALSDTQQRSSIEGKAFRTSIQCEDGTLRTIDIQPIFPHDSGEYLYLAITDVTDQIFLEQDYERQKEILQWIESNSSDFIAVIDDESVIRYASASYQNIFGRSVDEVINQPALKFIHPDDHQFVFERLKESVEGYIWWFPTEFRYLHGDGRWIYIDVRATPVYTKDGVRQITIFARDIQQRKEQEALIQKMAYYDPLTDLPNRHSLNEQLDFLIQRCPLASQITILFIDLDGFKEVNDQEGHTMGDYLLSLVGKRLRRALVHDEFIARMGGDEFVVLLDERHDHAKVEQVANQVLQWMREPFDLHGKIIHLSASIGISVYPQSGMNAEEIIRTADVALYQAKDAGKNRSVWYQA